MAGLRVFVSSTCFDLEAQRSQIRGLLNKMGYEPIMSDHSDVLFDPRVHTNTSCIKQVSDADMMILVIGSRFGGVAIPEAVSEIDLASAAQGSSKSESVAEPDRLSITQVEVLKAIENEIPLFAFVDAKVYSDHHLYTRNKHQTFSTEICYPSIDNQESAKYIFEFVTFITHRSSNNSLIPYTTFADIENHLVKQWSMMFQRLLREEREVANQARRADAILEQIQDVKAAILQTMTSDAGRDIARSVIRFRRLIDFLLAMQAVGPELDLAHFVGTFDDLLSEYGVTQIKFVFKEGTSITRSVLEREEDHIVARVPDRRFEQFYREWRTFSQQSEDTKKAVLDGVADVEGLGLPILFKVDGRYEEDSPEVENPDDDLAEEPNSQVGGSWTEERIETLLKMWADGASASKIAETLGGVSRNAVIGKAHRLGLPFRPAPNP